MNLLQSLKILGSDWIKITYLYKPLYSIRFVFDSSSIQPDLSIPSNNQNLETLFYSPHERNDECPFYFIPQTNTKLQVEKGYVTDSFI